MKAGLANAITAMAEARAARLRSAILAQWRSAGVADVAVEGETVRASGRGLMARWLDDPELRDAGRGGV